MALGISSECHYAECWYAECRDAECHYAEGGLLFFHVLPVVMLCVIRPNVVMLSVVMLSVMAPLIYAHICINLVKLFAVNTNIGIIYDKKVLLDWIHVSKLCWYNLSQYWQNLKDFGNYWHCAIKVLQTGCVLKQKQSLHTFLQVDRTLVRIKCAMNEVFHLLYSIFGISVWLGVMWWRCLMVDHKLFTELLKIL